DRALSGTPPRRDGDFVRAVEYLGCSRPKSVRAQDILGGLLGHTRKASFAAWQVHTRCLRQPKRVVLVQEHPKHAWPADDGDGSGWHAGKVAGRFKIGASGIP